MSSNTYVCLCFKVISLCRYLQILCVFLLLKMFKIYCVLFNSNQFAYHSLYLYRILVTKKSAIYIYDALCTPPGKRLQCHPLFISACCTNCSPEEKSCISLTTWFPLIYSIQHKDHCAHSPKRLLFSGKLATRLGSKNLHFFLQNFLFVWIIPDISSSLLPWRQHDPIPYWPTTHDWECDYLMIHFHMQIWMPTFT